jgi:HAE1 family hydrophobic/amphiphilic exporter-1
MSGSVSSVYREEGEEYDIRVRYPKNYRASIEDIANTIVYTPTGNAVRIKDLGTIQEGFVPPTIERKNRERYIDVTGVVAGGHALSDAVAATEQIVKGTNMPGNISTDIGGSYEDQQDMFGDLLTLMVLIVILVYMVMASQFESFISPLVIMFSVPFAITGVILGLRVGNTPLSVMAMIGLLILIGIVVKNGIVLIDYTNLMRERGMSIVEASVTAARSRLRPILMTTLTTVLGMIPMAVGQGEGAEMWRPLGLTVAWGLTVSTVVTLILIPVIYCAVSTLQEKRRQRKEQKEAEAEIAEA